MPQKLSSLKQYITTLVHHGAIYLCKSGYLSAEAKAAIVSEQGGGGGHGVRLSVDWSPGGRGGDGHASGQM